MSTFNNHPPQYKMGGNSTTSDLFNNRPPTQSKPAVKKDVVQSPPSGWGVIVLRVGFQPISAQGGDDCTINPKIMLVALF